MKSYDESITRDDSFPLRSIGCESGFVSISNVTLTNETTVRYTMRSRVTNPCSLKHRKTFNAGSIPAVNTNNNPKHFGALN